MGAGSQPFNPSSLTFQATTIQQEAVSNGYMAIALAYSNSFDGTIGDLCDALEEAPYNCFGLGHEEVIYGTDVSTVVDVAPADGVLNRFNKLNAFLKINMVQGFPFPAGIAGPEVDWTKTRVGGHSEGGGNAALIAQDYRLEQICYFASPADYIDDIDGNVYAPPGILAPYATPTSLMRGMVSVDDGLYSGISTNYAALNMPQSTSETVPNNNWLALTIKLPRPHTSITTDSRLAYARVWACFQDAPLIAATITNVSPLKAPVGATITLKGTNLSTTQGVLLNGLNVPFTVVSSTELSATVSDGANTGPVGAYVRSSGTISSALNFTVSPVVNTISPVSGPMGTPVTLTGFGFNDVTMVQLNGVSVPFTKDSDTQITATITSGSNTGLVSVTTPAGTANTLLGFVVMPTVTAFTPSLGPVGTLMTITGSGFITATNVTVGTVDASSFSVDSDTQITATVAPNTATGLVRVIGQAGMVSASLASFTVVLPPMITEVTPTLGVQGTVVTINGINFVGTTSVLFNGVPAGFSLVSGTSLAVVVPAGATTGLISVVNGAGTATSGPFTVYPIPQIASFSPLNGPVGTVITITGSGLTGATEVSVGFQALPFAVISDAQITVMVQSSTPSGLIRVNNPVTGAVSIDAFTVIQPPVLSNFTPSDGSVGTVVTLTGANLIFTTAVSFNGVPANFTVTSPTSLTAVIPPSATTGTITVTNPAGSFTTTETFLVYQIPQILSVTPSQGRVGTVFKILGSGFTGTNRVLVNLTDALFSLDSDTQITVTVPTEASTGPVTVINPAGVGVSSTSFIVIQPPAIGSFSPTVGPVDTLVTLVGVNFGTTNGVRFNGIPANFTVLSGSTVTAVVPPGATTGPITLTNPVSSVTTENNFIIIQPPLLNGFNPTVGTLGTSVVLGGSNFGGTTSVLFNGVPTTFTVQSQNRIQTSVPIGATTGTVTVVNGAGTATSTQNFVVNYAAPLVNSVAPLRANLGNTVTLTGNNFLGTTKVTFNGLAATFTVNSASQLSATVPPTATSGSIQITTPGGQTTLAGFIVNPSAVRTLGWQQSGSGDFNGDGKSDLLWRNYTTGGNRVWFMDGTAYLGQADFLSVSDPTWQLVGAGDLTGDGKADLVWRNCLTGQNSVWQMNGTTFVAAIDIQGVSDTNWQLSGVGDLTGDLQPDLIWRNYSTGDIYVWQMVGYVYQQPILVGNVLDPYWQLAGVADLTQDGRLDMIWRYWGLGAGTGDVYIWQMDGYTYRNATYIGPVTDFNFQLTAVADLTRDGQPDLMWSNNQTNDNYLWQMNGYTYVTNYLIGAKPSN